MLRKCTIVVAGMLVLALLTSPTEAQTTLTPSDDTYTQLSPGSGSNFDASALFADYTTTGGCQNTSRTYLRFDLSALTGDFESDTTLGLYVVLPPIYSGSLALWSTGDDWNGADAGLGDETTLTWDNAPSPDTKLTVTNVGTTKDWIEFTGSEIVNYLNSQQSANGGDDVVSFVVQWDGCATEPEADTVVFEDREDYTSTGNIPYLQSEGPTTVTLSSFRVLTASAKWMSFAACLLVIAAGVALAARQCERKKR